MSINNIFDILKNITSIKNEKDLGTEIFNPYMVSRYMSMDYNYIKYASILNRYYNIPKDQQELFLFYVIPKKYVFLKYIKKDKAKNIPIENIQNELNISTKKAQEINIFLNRLSSIRNGANFDEAF